MSDDKTKNPFTAVPSETAHSGNTEKIASPFPERFKDIQIGHGYNMFTRKLTHPSQAILNPVALMGSNALQVGAKGLGSATLYMGADATSSFNTSSLSVSASGGFSGFGIDAQVGVAFKHASETSKMAMGGRVSVEWLCSPTWIRALLSETKAVAGSYTSAFAQAAADLVACGRPKTHVIPGIFPIVVQTEVDWNEWFKKYLDIVETFGTHVVTAVGYGTAAKCNACFSSTSESTNDYNAFTEKAVFSGFGVSVSQATEWAKAVASASSTETLTATLMSDPFDGYYAAAAGELFSSLNGMAVSELSKGISVPSPSEPPPSPDVTLPEKPEEGTEREMAEAVEVPDFEERVKQKTVEEAKSLGFKGDDWAGYEKWTKKQLDSAEVEEPEEEPEAAPRGDLVTAFPVEAPQFDAQPAGVSVNGLTVADFELTPILEVIYRKPPVLPEVIPPASIAYLNCMKKLYHVVKFVEYMQWAIPVSKQIGPLGYDPAEMYHSMMLGGLFTCFENGLRKLTDAFGGDGVEAAYRDARNAIDRFFDSYEELKQLYRAFRETGIDQAPEYGWVIQFHTGRYYTWEGFSGSGNGVPHTSNALAASADQRYPATRLYPLLCKADGGYRVAAITYGRLLDNTAGVMAFSNTSATVYYGLGCLGDQAAFRDIRELAEKADLWRLSYGQLYANSAVWIFGDGGCMSLFVTKLLPLPAAKIQGRSGHIVQGLPMWSTPDFSNLLNVLFTPGQLQGAKLAGW